MRRKDKEIADVEKIEDVIRQASVCFLALCDGLQPYVVPLSFGYARRVLYFHSAAAGRKIDLIRRNPRVGFALESGHAVLRAATPCNWGLQYRSVIGEGLAAMVSDPSEKRFGLDRILAQYGSPGQDYDARRLEETCVIRVAIDRMSGKRSG